MMFRAKTILSRKPKNYGQPDNQAPDAEQRRPPKLTVGESNDPLEHQADATADRVMRMPEGFVQRKCAECEQEEHLQRKENAGGRPTVSERTDQAIRSSSGEGAGMDGATQSFMSSRMGQDFSNVKIHTDREAVRMNRELSAKAFTVGRDIYFNEGEYQPSSHAGQHLLAHELAHTVQQGKRLPILQKHEDPDTLTAVSDEKYDEISLDMAKDKLLRMLHASDLASFLSTLRELDPSVAKGLLEDPVFWKEIKATFYGLALWDVFTILYFHNEKTIPQRQLTAALSDRNIADAMDAMAIIIANNDIQDDRYWNTLREVAFVSFETDPRLPALFRMIMLPDGAVPNPEKLTFNSHEAHYEFDESVGANVIKEMGGERSMTVYTTANEFRVIVIIRFVDANDLHHQSLKDKRPFFFTGAEAGNPEKWAAKIRSVWNNQFELVNGINRLRFTVEPIFTYERGQENAIIQVPGDRTKTCPDQSTPGRADSGCWFSDSNADTISHEFGHLLGASDEYNLPETEAEIPDSIKEGLTPVELAVTTVSGLAGLNKSLGNYVITTPCAPEQTGTCVQGQMGYHQDSTEVLGRHIWLLVTYFNATQPPAYPYRIRKL
jgi:hypothetical protein